MLKFERKPKSLKVKETIKKLKKISIYIDRAKFYDDFNHLTVF